MSSGVSCCELTHHAVLSRLDVDRPRCRVARVCGIRGSPAERQINLIHQLLEHTDGAAFKICGDAAVVDGGLEFEDELVTARAAAELKKGAGRRRR